MVYDKVTFITIFEQVQDCFWAALLIGVLAYSCQQPITDSAIYYYVFRNSEALKGLISDYRKKGTSPRFHNLPRKTNSIVCPLEVWSQLLKFLMLRGLLRKFLDPSPTVPIFLEILSWLILLKQGTEGDLVSIESVPPTYFLHK